MSERLLDDLARALATPMPRRRALRLVGTFVAAAAFQRPSPAGAHARPGHAEAGSDDWCRAGTRLCWVGTDEHPTPADCCDDDRPYCCAGPTCAICCGKPAPGKRFAGCVSFCGCRYECADGYTECARSSPSSVLCCGPNERCVNRTCRPACPAGQFPCGSYCCPQGSACENGRCVRSREVCRGPRNVVLAVQTSSGDDLGLTGSYLRVGQTIRAREEMRLTLGDGSVLILEKGGGFRVSECMPELTALDLLIGTIKARIARFLAGSKFEVRTAQAILGHRGTVFSVSYAPAAKRTTVRVTAGSVYFRQRFGARRAIIVKAGQTAVQEGNGPPRLTKR